MTSEVLPESVGSQPQSATPPAAIRSPWNSFRCARNDGSAARREWPEHLARGRSRHFSLGFCLATKNSRQRCVACEGTRFGVASRRVSRAPPRSYADPIEWLGLPEEALLRIFVLFAHPVETSFNAAIHAKLVATLRSRGHEIDDCDLNAEGFDPVMSRQDRIRAITRSASTARASPRTSIAFSPPRRWCSRIRSGTWVSPRS